MTQRTHDQRLEVVAALYGDQPPPGASRDLLERWVRQRAACGDTDEQIAVASGLDVGSVRRILGERGR